MVIAQSRFIQVRSSKTSKGRKKLYCKGYASTKGLYDTYKWMKNSDGTYKSFRSLFTDECIEDMRRQAMSKSIFIDAQHTIATDVGILKLLEDNGADPEAIAEAKIMLKHKKLPFAKAVEFEVDDDGFLFASETNPWFAEVDEEHSRYYDSTIGSIEDGYIKGYSINFDPVDSTTTTDDKGNEWTQFQKVNLYGISYTDNLSLETNLFTEVAIRSMRETMNKRTKVNNMETRNSKVINNPDTGSGGDNVNLNDKDGGKITPPVSNSPSSSKQPPIPPPTDPIPPPHPPAPASTDPIEIEVQKRLAEIEKAKKIESDRVEQAQTIADLKKNMEELRGKPSNVPPIPGNTGQSIVQQKDKFGNPITPPTPAQTDPNAPVTVLPTKEQLDAHLKEIVRQHDKHMEDLKNGVNPNLATGSFFGGWGEIVALQAMAQSQFERKFGETDDQYNYRKSLLGRDTTDSMVISRFKE